MAETDGQESLNFTLQIKERLQEVQEALQDSTADSGVLVDLQRLQTAAQGLQPTMLPTGVLTQIMTATTAAQAAKVAVDAALALFP